MLTDKGREKQVGTTGDGELIGGDKTWSIGRFHGDKVTLQK